MLDRLKCLVFGHYWHPHWHRGGGATMRCGYCGTQVDVGHREANRMIEASVGNLR